MSDEATPESGAAPSDPFEGPAWHGSGRRRPRSSGDAAPVEDAQSASQVRRVRRRRSKYAKRRKRRRILLGGGVIVLALVAAVAWLLYTGLRARHELEVVRAEVRQLRAQIAAGELDEARTTAANLRTHAARAHDLTTGPLWATAAGVPWAGDPLDSARAVTSGVDELAGGTLPSLVDASTTLDPQSLRRPDGSVDLASIAGVAPELDRAANSLDSVVHRIDGAPSSTWLGSVDSARRDLLAELTGFRATVDSANVAAHVVPPLLGADGPRSYMVGFENEAELRGTGGLPGAFGILRVDHGKFHFTRFENDNVLTHQATNLDFGTDYNRLWTYYTPTLDYRDSNASPHFPYAAQIWLAQWKAYSGQQLDGAVTLDPTALSYLLRVTGPTTMADGTKVTAANVVALTQNTVYKKYGSEKNDQRKEFLLRLARAVSTKLIDSKADSTALVKAAARAASERRLLLWSSDAAVQRRLEPTKISGVVPDDSDPYMGVALNNASPSKLDYYARSSVRIQRSGCGDTTDVTVTVTLRNGAPEGLTPYMYGQYGGPKQVPEAGDSLTLVSYYATKGAAMTGITEDGRPTGVMSGTERGHPVFTIQAFLEPGQQKTWVMHLTEPVSSGDPTLRVTPMVHPMRASVTTESCG